MEGSIAVFNPIQVVNMKTSSSVLLKKGISVIIVILILQQISDLARAQGPEGKEFGFGILLGDPLGVTVKLWTAHDQAFVADFGASYFGPLRLQGDYLWHFDAFHSYIVKMYAGPGLALGFGHSDDRFFDDDDPNATHVGVGMRVMFGINIIPQRTPIEIFLEVGPMIAFVPSIGVGVDAGAGIRFYP